MLTVAIVEDDEKYSGLMQKFIEKFSAETGEKFNVKVYCDGMKFLSECEDGFNIVFMDIEMPIIDGMKTAKRFRAVDGNASIIFVTNMAQYAVKGYEVDAMDFLVKPVEYFVFYLKFEKAIRLQKKSQDNSLVIQSNEGLIKKKLSNIYFVESRLHFVIYKTDEGEIRCRATMKETEQKLLGKNFVRCNNSILVNLSCIEKIKGETVIVADNILPISRSRKKEFMDAVSVYYRGL